jgi:tRNA pseudouridine38-40 synthase
MRRIALVLEYEGTRYAGFQVQPTASSVQGTVEDAVKQLTGFVTRVFGAGRTDAGVHARQQVACFDTESGLEIERFRTGLNHFMADDVAVTEAYDVDDGFDPRRHAVRRTYRYTMLESRSRSPLRARFVHHVGQRLNVAYMNAGLRLLEGEKDCSPFCGNWPQSGRTIRTMYRAEAWRQYGDEVCLELEANAYLHQQVRRVAGAILSVGLGKMKMNEFAAIVDSKVHGAASLVLPAKGLSLVRVKYRDFPPTTERSVAEHSEVTVG